ncbi:hypothetical protein SHIRM173S_13132 [Streptomyces hirsutus]
MSAARPLTLLRAIAVTATLPLLLTACGYGSESTDDGKQSEVAADAEKLSVDEVKLGYFPNLTHANALVGIEEGLLQKELGATGIKSATFNAGPSEIEALNAGSIDIGWIGPSPSINGFTKSQGKNLRIISGSASGGVKLVVNPDRIKSEDDLKGKKIATPQLGNTQDVAFLNWIAEKALEGQRAERQGRRLRRPHRQQGGARRLQVRFDRRRLGPGADGVQAGRGGRRGAARRGRPVAGQEVRDHEHHRVAEVPQGAPGRRRGRAARFGEDTTGKATATPRVRNTVRRPRGRRGRTGPSTSGTARGHGGRRGTSPPAPPGSCARRPSTRPGVRHRSRRGRPR